MNTSNFYPPGSGVGGIIGMGGLNNIVGGGGVLLCDKGGSENNLCKSTNKLLQFLYSVFKYEIN